MTLLPNNLPIFLVHHLTTRSSQKRTANHHNGSTGQLNRAVGDGTRGEDCPYTRERKGSWEGIGWLRGEAFFWNNSNSINDGKKKILNQN